MDDNLHRYMRIHVKNERLLVSGTRDPVHNSCEKSASRLQEGRLTPADQRTFSTQPTQVRIFNGLVGCGDKAARVVVGQVGARPRSRPEVDIEAIMKSPWTRFGRKSREQTVIDHIRQQPSTFKF